MAILIICLISGMPAWADDSGINKPPLYGEAKVTVSRWNKLYSSGLKDIKNRVYPLARSRLEAALKQLRKTGTNDIRLIKTKIALADVYTAMGRYKKTGRFLRRTLADSRKIAGERSYETALCLSKLAWIETILGRYEKAENLARRSLAIQESSSGTANQLKGHTARTLAMALAGEHYFDESAFYINQAIEIFRQNPGKENLDLADTLRMSALIAQGQGRMEAAKERFRESADIKESAVEFNLPPWLAGVVEFPWDPEASSSYQISEGKYPLKCTKVRDIRVAATMVDLRQVLGVLVSVANTGRNPIKVGLGPISMDRLKPSIKHLTLLNPTTFDYVLEQQTMFYLTRNHPTLYELQNTHIPPRVPPGKAPKPSNKFRKNIYGLFGNWITEGNRAPDMVAIEREWARHHPLAEPDKFVATTLRNLDMYSIVLDPGESRTSVVFFKNEPHDEVMLKVLVGNASLDFPFRYAGPFTDYH